MIKSMSNAKVKILICLFLAFCLFTYSNLSLLRNNLGYINLLKSRESDARRQFLASNSHPRSLYGLGMLELAEQRPVNALSHLDEYLVVYPSDVLGHIKRAEIFVILNQEPVALNDWKTIKSYDVLMSLAEQAYEEDKVSASNQLYLLATQTERAEWLSFYFLGITHIELNAFDQGRDALAVANLMDPQNPTILFPLGKVELELENFEDAIKYLNQYQEFYPSKIPSLIYSALSYEALNKHEDAISMAKRITQYEQDNYNAHLILARNYEALGQYKNALNEYYLTVELISDDQFLDDTIQRLESKVKGLDSQD